MKDVFNVAEFLDPSVVPTARVRIAAFDGENADPANGRPMGDGVRAHTPWGEIAYQLAGKTGYEIVRLSDEQRIAPGADTIKELFGSEPVLVVLDELGEYLRRVQGMGGRDQLTGFLKALLTAIESTPKAAVVYTLAVRSDGKGVDAFAEENEFLANSMYELGSGPINWLARGGLCDSRLRKGPWMSGDLFWLSDAQFAKIEPLLPTKTRGVKRVDDRRVISGIIHVQKSGCRWVDAPPEYGPRKTLYNRFVRWADKGVWVGLFETLARSGGPKLQLMIDSSAVKAHRSAAGGKGGRKIRRSVVPVAAEPPRFMR